MRFLFVDRIVESSPGQWIRGVKHITADDTFLSVDEHGRPCFIASLIGESLGQLAAWNVMQLQGLPVDLLPVSLLRHRCPTSLCR